MSAVAELDPPRRPSRPTVNYIVNDGAKLYHLHRRARLDRGRRPAAPPIRTRSPCTTRRPHLGRIQARRSTASASSHHRDQDEELLRRRRDQARLLPGDGSADQSRERRQARRGVRSYAAHRRRRGPRGAARSARPCAAPTTTTPNGPARSGCATSCRTKPTSCSSAASPSSRCGGRSAIRSRPHPLAICRRPQRLVRRLRDLGAALSQPDRPDLRRRLQSRGTSGTGCRAMRRDEALVFKVYDSDEGRPRPLDRPHRLRRSRPRRPTPARVRASKSARWRFSGRPPHPASFRASG